MDFKYGRTPLDDAQRKYNSALPQLANYPLPDPVSQWSGTSITSQALGGASVSQLFPILANDRLGDCTIAGAAHQITLQYGATGQKVLPSENDVVSLYYKLGHNRDNGLPLSTVTNAWLSGILGGYKIFADMLVDPSNMKAVKQAIQYLGGLYIGFGTTSHSVSQFQQGQPWDDRYPPDGGGHCVVLTGFDDYAQTFSALTWGGLQPASFAWFRKYVDECHAVPMNPVSQFDQQTNDQIKDAMKGLVSA